jgi:hypothetical protein
MVQDESAAQRRLRLGTYFLMMLDAADGERPDLGRRLREGARRWQGRGYGGRSRRPGGDRLAGRRHAEGSGRLPSAAARCPELVHGVLLGT